MEFSIQFHWGWGGINFGKKQEWPQEQHLAELGDPLPWGVLEKELSKHPHRLPVGTGFREAFRSIRSFAVSNAHPFPFSSALLWDGVGWDPEHVGTGTASFHLQSSCPRIPFGRRVGKRLQNEVINIITCPAH